ncbi:MAG: 30S ribosome-binding factor RbfA [Anaerolineales bacterium]|nr:30S ribosome-binding factor RbfA [Anaerolineales bacterium]MCB8966322.1 30S ribosome-binding factor RbfA [Ardenticatenaceae bacterium]
MSKIRQQRTAEQIQLLLSELIQRDIQDPRLLGITITRVTIDRELQHADIYVNALGDETRQKEVMQALQKATGFFRHELAQRMQVRTIPQLHFRWDPTLAHAEAVHQILENLEIPVEEAAEEAADDDE